MTTDSFDLCHHFVKVYWRNIVCSNDRSTGRKCLSHPAPGSPACSGHQNNPILQINHLTTLPSNGLSPGLKTNHQL
jgi:hypothetical protein